MDGNHDKTFEVIDEDLVDAFEVFEDNDASAPEDEECSRGGNDQPSSKENNLEDEVKAILENPNGR